MKNEGFTKIRNGLMPHVKAGKLSLSDMGLYLFLHMACDWRTGIYEGTALGIAYGIGNSSAKRAVQYALSNLRAVGFINYRLGTGSRGHYSVLIDKFEPSFGERTGSRLNAWKHGSKAVPEYEAVNGQLNGDCTVVERSLNGDCTETARTPDLPDVPEYSPDVQDVQDNNNVDDARESRESPEQETGKQATAEEAPANQPADVATPESHPITPTSVQATTVPKSNPAQPGPFLSDGPTASRIVTRSAAKPSSSPRSPEPQSVPPGPTTYPCADCGNPTTLDFEPDLDRPIYCRPCFVSAM